MFFSRENDLGCLEINYSSRRYLIGSPSPWHRGPPAPVPLSAPLVGLVKCSTASSGFTLPAQALQTPPPNQGMVVVEACGSFQGHFGLAVPSHPVPFPRILPASCCLSPHPKQPLEAPLCLPSAPAAGEWTGAPARPANTDEKITPKRTMAESRCRTAREALHKSGTRKGDT